MAQVVEHVLGKDEVTGSNPVNSSKGYQFWYPFLFSQKELIMYQRISFEQAKALIDAGEHILLDVREEEEFIAGHARGAVLLPLGSIDMDSALDLIPDFDTPILLYCRTGRRTKLAAEKLDDLGYNLIYDLGGLAGWPYGIDYGED